MLESSFDENGSRNE